MRERWGRGWSVLLYGACEIRKRGGAHSGGTHLVYSKVEEGLLHDRDMRTRWGRGRRGSRARKGVKRYYC